MNSELFSEFVQIFSDRMATTLHSSTLVTYPTHDILCGVLMIVIKRFINCKATLRRFLALCCSDKDFIGEESGEDDDIFLYAFTSSMTVLFRSGVRVTEDSASKRK